jgi:hypothetical protein
VNCNHAHRAIRFHVGSKSAGRWPAAKPAYYPSSRRSRSQSVWNVPGLSTR